MQDGPELSLSDYIPACLAVSEAGVIRLGQNPQQGVKLWDSRGRYLAYAVSVRQPRTSTCRSTRSAMRGVAEEHIYVDKRTGANMDREGLRTLLGFVRPCGRINVLAVDLPGRNMCETLNLVHDLADPRTPSGSLQPGPPTAMLGLLRVVTIVDFIGPLPQSSLDCIFGQSHLVPGLHAEWFPICAPCR